MDISTILASPAFWAAVVVGLVGLLLSFLRSRSVARSIAQQIEADADEDKQARKQGKLAADKAERRFREDEANLRRLAERKYKAE